MGDALLTRKIKGGITLPPNSIEIETVAAEDIQAGEFVTVGFNSSDEATVEQNSFELSILPTPIFSNKEPDGLFWATDSDTKNSYLLKINETGTVEIGTTIPKDDGDTTALTQLLRYDNIFIGISSGRYYLYNLEGITLTKITSLAPLKSYIRPIQVMYDINNKLVLIGESTTSSTSSISYDLLHFTDSTMERLNMSKTTYPGTVTSIKTTNGYKIIFAGYYTASSAFVEFWNCDDNFQNITLSKRVEIAMSNIMSSLLKGVFADDGYLYIISPYASSGISAIVSLYRIKIDYDNELSEIESTQSVKYAATTKTPSSHYLLMLGGVIGFFYYAQTPTWHIDIEAALLPNATFNNFSFLKKNILKTADIFFISNNKMIIRYKDNTCYIVDLLMTYNNQIIGNALAKTSTLTNNKIKNYIKKLPSMTYYIG